MRCNRCVTECVVLWRLAVLPDRWNVAIEVECCVMMRSSIREVVSARAAMLMVVLCLCAASAGFAQSPRGGAAATAPAASHSVFPTDAHDSLDALYRGNAEAAIVIAR